MAYDEFLSDRIKQCFTLSQTDFIAKKMFGGLCFMVDSKMCVGIIQDKLMARVGPDYYPEAILKEGVDAMDFTKRPMKGYVYVSPDAVDLDSDLEFWINKALEFNPLAKASKKKKK